MDATLNRILSDASDQENTLLKLGLFVWAAKTHGKLDKSSKKMIFEHLFEQTNALVGGEFNNAEKTLKESVELCCVSEILDGLYTQTMIFKYFKEQKFKILTSSGQSKFVGLNNLSLVLLLGARGWFWRFLAVPLAVWVNFSLRTQIFFAYYTLAGKKNPTASSSDLESRRLILKMQRLFLIAQALKTKGLYTGKKLSRSLEIFVEDFYAGDTLLFLANLESKNADV